MSGKPKGGAAATEKVQARLTPAEASALETLQKRRAADLVARSEPPDESFVGWLRWIIRREAKAAGIEVDAPPPPAEPRQPRAR